MAEQPSRKRGYRKVKLTSVKTEDSGDVVVPAGERGPLPGESGPLVWEPGRDWPVTDEEALGLMRRREARELASTYAESTVDALKAGNMPSTLEEALRTRLPALLPAWDTKAQLMAYRLPPRLLALFAAKAQLEGLSANALLETIIWQAVHEPARDPQVAKAVYDQMKAETVLAERAAQDQKRP